MSGVLYWVVTIIVGLLLLTALVVAHEFGHFLVGKKLGFGINEFAAGFGPKLLSKVKNGIRYSLRAIPIGGFVSFVGEDEEVENDPKAFNNRPIWQRFLTILAGPVFNFLLAIIITACTLSIFGDAVPVINTVSSGSGAEQAGIAAGDRVVEINGKKIDFYSELSTSVLLSESDTIKVGVERNGQNIEKTVHMTKDADTGYYKMGVTLHGEIRRFSIFEAIGLSFKWLFLMISQTLQSLKLLIFQGRGASQVSGVVGIISLTGTAVKYGAYSVMSLAALISVSLGIMNLLPFPALDGGRIVMLAIEKIRGKAIPRNKEAIINVVGLVILFGLMIVVTYNDILRLISGG